MLPKVSAIMLYADRPHFLGRALQSFRSQSYENKELVIYDNGDCPLDMPLLGGEVLAHGPRETIGKMRNKANAIGTGQILCHADVDDWSYPQRLAEQVALLQSSGADAVGYNRALFWDTRICSSCKVGQPYIDHQEPGRWHGTSMGPHRCDSSAWEYGFDARNYALGASLCYWRKTWERVPFDNISHGEDRRFVGKVQALGISTFDRVDEKGNLHGPVIRALHTGEVIDVTTPIEPRVIFSIHGGNTSVVKPDQERACFRRAAEFDEYCRKAMAL